MNPDDGPLCGPHKSVGFAGEKPQGSGGPCLWGQQWTRLPFSYPDARSTATTGAWPSPTTPASGVHNGDHGPFRLSLGNGWFAGEQPQGPGVRALWGQQWARLAFPTQTREVLPQRGHGLRPPPRRLGSTTAITAPSGGSLETAGLQGNSRRVRGSVPFGGSNGLVWLTEPRPRCRGYTFATTTKLSYRLSARPIPGSSWPGTSRNRRGSRFACS
jgi:hypothetical protein